MIVSFDMTKVIKPGRMTVKRKSLKKHKNEFVQAFKQAVVDSNLASTINEVTGAKQQNQSEFAYKLNNACESIGDQFSQCISTALTKTHL